MENLASQFSTLVPQVAVNLAAGSATSDFCNSPYFQPSELIAAQAKSTVERIKEHPIVLAVQDTTSLDLTRQKAKKGKGNGLSRLSNILWSQSSYHIGGFLIKKLPDKLLTI